MNVRLMIALCVCVAPQPCPMCMMEVQQTKTPVEIFHHQLAIIPLKFIELNLEKMYFSLT